MAVWHLICDENGTEQKWDDQNVMRFKIACFQGMKYQDLVYRNKLKYPCDRKVKNIAEKEDFKEDIKKMKKDFQYALCHVWNAYAEYCKNKNEQVEYTEEQWLKLFMMKTKNYKEKPSKGISPNFEYCFLLYDTRESEYRSTDVTLSNFEDRENVRRQINSEINEFIIMMQLGLPFYAENIKNILLSLWNKMETVKITKDRYGNNIFLQEKDKDQLWYERTQILKIVSKATKIEDNKIETNNAKEIEGVILKRINLLFLSVKDVDENGRQIIRFDFLEEFWEFIDRWENILRELPLMKKKEQRSTEEWRALLDSAKRFKIQLRSEAEEDNK